MNRLVRLGDVTSSVSMWTHGERSPEGKFTYVDISSIDSAAKRIVTPPTVLVSAAPSRARQMLKSGDVLVSSVRPNLNAVAVVPPELDGAIGSTGFAVLRPDTAKIHARYLFHWVRTPSFVRGLVARATGASYPAVTESVIRESKVPLPALADQFRIAEMLDKADEVGRKRKESLRLLDEFLGSAFFEMFGDPVRSESGWNTVKLEEISEIVSGVTIGRKLDVSATTDVPYLRVANVHDGHLDLAEVKTTPATHQDRLQYRLLPGDVVLTEGGDPDKLGRGAVWRGEIGECIHQNHIFRVRFQHGFVPDYVSALLGSTYGKRYFLRAAKQTTGIASINRTQLGSFPVIAAPHSLQRQYEAVVALVTSLTTRYRSALEDTECLGESIAQSAFGCRQ